MSYLHLPRLTFSGDFISDVSTVNNDPQHYNNAVFEPSFQLPGQGASNGWWNPEGGATFSFQNCSVMQVTKEDGTIVTDPVWDTVIGQVVTGAEGRNSGKMVDLDPQQQMVSGLWGVTFRLLTAQNMVLLEGKIKTTSFRDLQLRQTNGGKPNGQPLGATWTSVLEDVHWGEAAESSPFLTALKATTQQNKISINLNAFGYYYAHADGRFSLGRILGSIGPWFSDEPELFAPARRLYGTYQQGSGQSIFFSATNFLFDVQNARLSVDLGSSFPVSDSIGTISLTTDLYFAVNTSKTPLTNAPSAQQITINSSDLLLIGKVDYTKGVKWINRTSGILDFNNLSPDVVQALAQNQLLLVSATATPTTYVLIAREAIGGIVCRADNFVQRIDTDQTVSVNIYAYQFGQPLPYEEIVLSMQPPTPVVPKEQNTPPICDVPGNNYPVDGLTFPAACKTNKEGMAVLSITGNSIKNPRKYLDGQIYFLDYNYRLITPDSANPDPLTISIHLRDDFPIPEEPVWSDIAPIMVQFANLYPIMSKYFIDFRDPQALIAKREILKFAFTRDITDPIYMPATRDLSENKRLTILKWLDNPVIDTPEHTSQHETALLQKHKESDLKDSQPETGTSTYYQQRLKEATNAKNGASMNFPVITNLFEF